VSHSLLTECRLRSVSLPECSLSLLFLFVAFTFDCRSFTSRLHLFVTFTSHCSSFTFSLSNALGFSVFCSCSFSLPLLPTTVTLSLSPFHFRLNGGFPFPSLCRSPALFLCRIHLRLLLFRFIAFKCIRLFVAFTSHCCSFTSSLSNAFGFSALSSCCFSLSLSPPTVVLSFSRHLPPRLQWYQLMAPLPKIPLTLS
jgi:hypothetical protein